MVDVLDDLFGLPVISGAVGVLAGRQCTTGDALDRPHHPLESPAGAVQLQYREVIQPDRMLSREHL